MMKSKERTRPQSHFRNSSLRRKKIHEASRRGEDVIAPLLRVPGVLKGFIYMYLLNDDRSIELDEVRRGYSSGRITQLHLIPSRASQQYMFKTDFIISMVNIEKDTKERREHESLKPPPYLHVHVFYPFPRPPTSQIINHHEHEITHPLQSATS